jgi:hypothetical protein
MRLEDVEEPSNCVRCSGVLRFSILRLLSMAKRESMKQSVEPESMRVQMFLRVSEYRLMYRVEGLLKEAVFRQTISSGADLNR